MNWFKKIIIKWVREDWDNSQYTNEAVPSPRLQRGLAIKDNTQRLDSDATLTFTVYNAIGGKVVEFRRYDRKTDRSEHSVYVIGKDEDFGAKISKISTLECMK